MESKAIVNLSFKITVPKEEAIKVFEHRRKNFTKSNGFVSFFCCWEESTKMISATYIFESRAKAEAYVDTFLIDGLGPKYNIIPQSLTLKILDIFSEIWPEDLE